MTTLKATSPSRLCDKECISEDCVACPYNELGNGAKVGAVHHLECEACHKTYIDGGYWYLALKNTWLVKGAVFQLVRKHSVERYGGTDLDGNYRTLTDMTEIPLSVGRFLEELQCKFNRWVYLIQSQESC